MLYLQGKVIGEYMNFLEKYNIKINNTKLLSEALTHSSYAYENNINSYEKLEFLGDAVLSVIVSEYLYNKHNLKEGQMTKIRASYVCEDALNAYAKEVGYAGFIKVGNAFHGKANETIIADVFEAILAVIYIDQGFETCKRYIYAVVIPHIQKKEQFFADYKTAFQEVVQTNQRSVIYEVESITDEEGKPLFKADAIVDGLTLGSGIGKSKKEAEQMAAKDALRKSAR